MCDILLGSGESWILPVTVGVKGLWLDLQLAAEKLLVSLLFQVVLQGVDPGRLLQLAAEGGRVFAVGRLFADSHVFVG